MNVGTVITSWNPLSHNEYWTDDDFTGPTAELMRDVVVASRSARESGLGGGAAESRIPAARVPNI